MLIRQALDLDGLPAGRALRVRRVALGLTATDAARLAGCTRQDLWAVETGQGRWPQERAKRERLERLYDRLDLAGNDRREETSGAA